MYGNIIPDFLSYFWDLGFFRFDFSGFFDDFWGDFCRIVGWVLICFQTVFEVFWEDLQRIFRGNCLDMLVRQHFSIHYSTIIPLF